MCCHTWHPGSSHYNQKTPLVKQCKNSSCNKDSKDLKNSWLQQRTAYTGDKNKNKTRKASKKTYLGEQAKQQEQPIPRKEEFGF